MQRVHTNSHVLLDLQPVLITDGLRDNLLSHGLDGLTLAQFLTLATL